MEVKVNSENNTIKMSRTFVFNFSAMVAVVALIGMSLSQLAPVAPKPRPGPSFCAWGENPVCADDYQTYPNLCAVQAAGVNFVHYGACTKTINANGEIEISCPNTLQEVCGKDGVTYGNDCRLNARKVTLAYPGPCRQASVLPRSSAAPIPCTCPLDYAPVCTLGGITYENQCILLCKQQIALTLEPCPSQFKCPRNYDPVCGADYFTYDNQCLLENMDVALIGYGECPNILNGCEKCSAVLLPVYGKNGVNYTNLCQLHCNKAEFGGYGKAADIGIQKSERIKKKCAECSKLFLPICGTDGKTYDNECLCTCTEQCVKYSNGICPSHNPGADPLVRFPECAVNGNNQVCATNNRTYENLCYMQKSGAIMQHPGPCQMRGNYSLQLPQNPAAVSSAQQAAPKHRRHTSEESQSDEAEVESKPEVQSFKNTDDAINWINTYLAKHNNK
jgi:hypothetical protein